MNREVSRIITCINDLGHVAAPLVTPPCGDISFDWATRPKLIRRQSSLSSVSSSNSDDEGNPFAVQDAPWTSEQLQTLAIALEEYAAMAQRCSTPFTGLPPSQLTHAMARAVLTKELDWNHTLKNTRIKLLELARHSHNQESGLTNDIEATPRLSSSSSSSSDSDEDMSTDVHPLDPEATPKIPKKKRKILARQYSMDFIPTPPSDPSSLEKLSNKLNAAEEVHHRMAAPMLRSSSLSSGSPSPMDISVFPSDPLGVGASPTRPSRSFTFGGPPSPALSETSSYSGSSLFSFHSSSNSMSSVSTSPTSGSGKSVHFQDQPFSSKGDAVLNAFGYPTPQSSSKKRPRPSLAVEGRLSSSPLKRHYTDNSLPCKLSELDSLPDSPTPFRASAFGLHSVPISFSPSTAPASLAPQAHLQTAAQDMNVDLDSPFQDSFTERHGWIPGV